MSRPGEQDVLDVLDSDHRALLDLLGRAAAESDPDEVVEACGQLVMNVVRHFVAEEQYLLPVVRASLDAGHQQSEAAFAEHADVEGALRRLERVDSSPDAVRPLLGQVGEKLRAHISRQDEAIFPALRAACPPERLVGLAEEVRGAEQLAPTRPRELRPESPALNKALSFVSGWIDHVRDFYEHRGVERDAGTDR